jgi:outer membrane protein assembly factor BamB
MHAVFRAGGTLRWAVDTGEPITSSPAIVGDQVIVVGGDRAVWALDLATGERRWRQ